MEKTLLYIALLLAATKAAGLLSRRLKMPEVLGALLAGVVLGPALLHLVPYEENIRLLSNLGVIFLMFLAGLETNVEQLKQAGRSSLLIGSLGILVPLVLGMMSASLFYRNVMENVFIGVILTATSVSITVETLTELGRLNTGVGVNILGAAVVDDILGLVLISVLLSVKNGGGAALVWTLAGIAGFCALSVLAIIFLPKILNRYAAKRKPSRRLFTFAIAAALLAAAFAESLGIAAITGAYFCGLLFSQFVHRDYLEKRIKTISAGFLAPIFFASVGLEASFSGFSSRMLQITLVLFAMAVLGKLIGCGLGARLCGISARESVQIGTGMISRGEVAMITANIGLQNHMITQEVFVPVIFVVLLTTMITPVLLKLSFSRRRRELPNRKG